MRRDRAAHLRSIAWVLSLSLAVSGLLVPATGTAAPASVATASATPSTYPAASPATGKRPAAEQPSADLRRAVRTAALSGTAHITGHVTTPDDEPVEYVTVVAYRWSSEWEEWDDVQYDETSSDGSYDLADLAAGTYRVGFLADGEFDSEYWDDVAELEDATDIVLVAAETRAGTDAQLAERGRITGTVTGPAGQPLGGIHVTVYAMEPYVDDDSWYEYTDAWTEADGTYDSGPLRNGSYRVQFFDHDTGYLAEYWNDTLVWDDAATIEVTAGAVAAGTDAELAVGAATAGDVTGPAGQPLAGVEVDVYVWSDHLQAWDWVYYTETGQDGRYVLAGLPTGVYRLGFADWTGSSSLSSRTTPRRSTTRRASPSRPARRWATTTPGSPSSGASAAP